MKKLVILAATMIGALLLTGCQGTSNSSTPAANTACNYNVATGQYTNASGGICTPTTGGNTCATQGLVYQNGVWVNPHTGQVVQCNQSGLPYTNYQGGGCNYWQQVTGRPHAIMYVGYQPYCVDLSSYGVTPPSGWNYSQPIYAYSCDPYYDPYCGYGWQNQSQYGLGFGFGSDYGQSGFFGISFSMSF